MSDDKKTRRPHPNKLNESYELAYWTKEIGVSENALRDAVAQVGVMVSVRAHLKK